MKILSAGFCNVIDETQINQLVAKSTVDKIGNLTLENGKEECGWVDFYFRYNNVTFKVVQSLALYDLSSLVNFFTHIINLQDETAIFLEDECISEPLLYVSPVNDEKIRFLIADQKEFKNNLKDDEDYEDDIYCYNILCDVIVEKKKLLKEFYKIIKNIIYNYTPIEHRIYDIGYEYFKDDLKKIISYLKYSNY